MDQELTRGDAGLAEVAGDFFVDVRRMKQRGGAVEGRHDGRPRRVWPGRPQVAVVLIVSIFVTALISSRLVRLITEPILQLAGIAGRVFAQEDYTLRGIPSSAMRGTGSFCLFC